MQRIGPYVLQRVLGRGGMGVVYEARHPDLNRPVALKLTTRGGSERGEARFLREGELLARVSHPNVAAVHASGEAPEGRYLVTDLIAGTPLDRALEEGPLPPRRAAEVVRALAGAVEALHQAGIVHRDLKPENAILRDDGSPVLIDFGLAFAGDQDRLTRTGAVLGTPHYMAPEQAGGRDGTAPDPRLDVYGLGGILFALLSGGAPFRQISDLQSLLVAVGSRDPGWGELGLSSALVAIGRKAMAKAPERRYGSAADLAQDLDRHLAGLKPHAQGSLQGPPAWLIFVVSVVIGGGLALATIFSGGPGAPEPTGPPARARVSEPVEPSAIEPAGGAAEEVAPQPRSWRRMGALDFEASRDARGLVGFLDPQRVVLVAGPQRGAFLWDLRTQQVRQLDLGRYQPMWSAVVPGTSQVVFVTPSPRDRLVVIDVDGGGPARALDVKLGTVTCLAASSDGVAYAGTEQGWVHVVPLEDPAASYTLVHDEAGSVGGVAVGGDVLAASSGSFAGPQGFKVRTWRRSDRTPLGSADVYGTSVALGVDPSGSRFAVGTNAGRLFVGSVDCSDVRALVAPGVKPAEMWVENEFLPGSDVGVAHVEGARSVVFSDDGRRLVSVPRTGDTRTRMVVRFWDVETGAITDTLHLTLRCTDGDATADFSRLAVGCWSGEFEAWELR
jgi:tRNA A-37 threonylcarbamoyl transferase component Bud32